MDYRIEHREHQQFIALVRTFPNEITNDDNDTSIPDFWTECYEGNLIEPMKSLRSEGKRDLYGLCSPIKGSETHFNYGIGIIIDEDTDHTELERFLNNGYIFRKRGKWAVLRAMGSC